MSGAGDTLRGSHADRGLEVKKPDWAGETAVIICAGPSLSDTQLEIVKASGAKTIGVNTAYFYFQPDVLYAGDMLFWKVHLARIKAQCPKTQLWTQDGSAAERYQLNRQRGGNRDGLGLDIVHMGGNSCYQAINLAFLWGCRRIVLVGVDMKVGPKGERHLHGDHEKPLVQSQCFDEWILKFKKMAEDLKTHGCEVINATSGSALKCFPFAPIEKALAC